VSSIELLVRLRRASGLHIEPPLQAFAEGFRHVLYRSPDGWMIRVGRAAHDGPRLLDEAAILERVSAAVPVPVPRPEFVAHSHEFPHGLMLYRQLSGVPLSPARPETLTRPIARQLGEALVALHGLGVDAPLPRASSEGWRRWLAEPRAWLIEALSTEERATLQRWMTELQSDTELERFTPRLVHGDLWFDHVLVDADRARLAGVVDFGDAGLGDPAQDLATQLHMGPEFFDDVLDAYEASSSIRDHALDRRIRRRWQLRELHGLWQAWKQDDRSELEDALRKLRRGPIFRGLRRDEC
jgi:aminoglycoside phosphotransferase (APT) family kinase protein